MTDIKISTIKKQEELKRLKDRLFSWNVVTAENKPTYDALCKRIKDLTLELESIAS